MQTYSNPTRASDPGGVTMRLSPQDFAGCRIGYADCDTFGCGFIARDTWSGCLDAPDFMPQGSVTRIGKSTLILSRSNRDINAGCAYPGTYATL